MSQPILLPGRNIWRRASADRLLLLVDGDAYFDAFTRTAWRARRSLVIVGWDVHGRTMLTPGRPLPGGGELGGFLHALLRARPDLQIFVLGWDFAFFYAFERELWPWWSLGGPAGLHHRFDDRHPVGGSHHQKIVIVDEQVAFVGGVDLAIRRWDTPAHAPHDTRRVDPRGQPYPPFHDVQLMVSGPVVTPLADIAKDRWQRAVDKPLPALATTSHDAWPPELAPDARNVELGIARTRPARGAHQAVREIEALSVDGIAAAERSLYIENQFLTSSRIAQALKASLARRRGPEVIVVGPRSFSGWLEQRTMGVLRDRQLAELYRADTYGRMRAYYPEVSGVPVNVHSKLFVVDDRLLFVGSANLTNRSMALDSECDLVIEAKNDTPHVFHLIATLRTRLLAEHLGVSPKAVHLAHSATGSLVEAIERLRSPERGLWLLRPDEKLLHDDFLPDAALIDPEQELVPTHVIDRLMPEPLKKERALPYKRVVVILVVLLAAGVLLRTTPLADWVDSGDLLSWAAALRDNPLAPLATTAVFVVGNLVFVPVTLLVVQLGVVFGPFVGAAYALAGALASASAAYWLGRLAGDEWVGKLGRSHHVASAGRAISRHSLFATAMVRLVPLAPFTLVNLAAGAARIRFRHYFLGTLIGMTPGIIALSTFGHQLQNALRRPTVTSIVAMGAVLIGFAAFGMWIRHRFMNRRDHVDAPSLDGAVAD